MSRPHGAAGWLSPSQRLELTAAIRAHRAADPRATAKQLAARVGVSPSFVAGVLRLMKERGEAPSAPTPPSESRT